MATEDQSDERFRAYAFRALTSDPSAEFGPVLDGWREQQGVRVPLQDSLRDVFEQEQQRVAMMDHDVKGVPAANEPGPQIGSEPTVPADDSRLEGTVNSVPEGTVQRWGNLA